MKVCAVCRETKPLSEFYSNSHMADGRINQCKACVCADRSRRRREDPKWRDDQRAMGRKSERHRYRKHGRKAGKGDIVRTQVKNAIAGGRVVPPVACEDCGHDFSEFRREAHHHDYSKPLAVRWLCAVCHGKRHSSHVRHRVVA